MNNTWDIERIKGASIAPRTAEYNVIPANDEEDAVKKEHPEIFNFKAISIGDNGGQLFLVPLDESDRGTAEYILRAISAYTGT